MIGNNLPWKKTVTVSKINLIITAGFLLAFNSTISLEFNDVTATYALANAGIAIYKSFSASALSFEICSAY